MGLLVLAYPKLSSADFQWIEAIRAEHNRADFEIIRPHVSLVFETAIMTCDKLLEHMTPVAASAQPFDLTFRAVMLMPGIVSAETFLFLVPDEGLSAAMLLLDRLYTGMLSSERRLDIPYIPHITIGRFDDPGACKALADDLMSQPIEIRAPVEAIELVEFGDGPIETLRRIPLG